MMMIIILIHVITIMHYLLITNIFHVFEKKQKQKQQKNTITGLKSSLVVGARTNFSEGIPSLITGLSLRAGGRGFPPATQSMAPGYFRR